MKLFLLSLVLLISCGNPKELQRETLYRQLPDKLVCIVHYGDYFENPSSPEAVAISQYPDFGQIVNRKLLFISKRGNPCYEITLQKYDKWKQK